MNQLTEMSEKFEIVLTMLMKAKSEIGSVKKDSSNPFHKSRYASLNAFIDASEDALTRNGLILLQAGNGSFGEPVLVSTLVHIESGQWIKSYFPILNPKSDCQGLGSAVTYMRRYSLCTLLGLVAEDDDGEKAQGRVENKPKEMNISKPVEKPEVSVTKMSIEQVIELNQLVKGLTKEYSDKFYKKIKSVYGKENISDLPIDAYPRLLKSLNDLIQIVDAERKANA